MTVWKKRKPVRLNQRLLAKKRAAEKSIKLRAGQHNKVFEKKPPIHLYEKKAEVKRIGGKTEKRQRKQNEQDMKLPGNKYEV